MSDAGVKLLAAVLGFWVIMRALNRDASGRTLANYLTGTSGSATATLPAGTAVAAANAATPTGAAAAQLGAAKTMQLTGGAGFRALPGTNFTVGQEPQIASDLQRLGQSLGKTIYGISGYRSPAHSVAVGGNASDPHTRGQAADIGVGSATRASAASIPERVLAAFGLWRPFDPSGDPNNPEVNHVELVGMR